MRFDTDIFSQFDTKWALLSAGKKDSHNTMTISWGGMGTLWSKPVVTVYVKPCRYTYKFMNDNDFFTVSFYPEDRKEALMLMGSKSGRDIDKDAEHMPEDVVKMHYSVEEPHRLFIGEVLEVIE